MVKIKIGDLTLKQFRHICDTSSCETCPLRLEFTKLHGMGFGCKVDFMVSMHLEDEEVDISEELLK